ncbi:MAG: 4'-phosphopantetheinyl transferase superfamily protein [Deltaproteobacteria bacterium]|nr:4'-phosphopantetheinyl transferase superfamily protein [Deltaproteobacteria bacterium]
MAYGKIHTLPGPVLGNTVVFASTESRRGAKHSLTLRLLRAQARLDSCRNPSPHEKAFTLYKGALGRPCLLLGDKQGPSLSFSHGEGRLWGAMCSEGSVGIDVAYPDEFAGGYPFGRAFSPEELDCAGGLCHNDRALGAALIWSVKEASVKATGAGFHFLDPLDVRVGISLFREQGILFEVSADRPISAWARAEGHGWIAVAWT